MRGTEFKRKLLGLLVFVAPLVLVNGTKLFFSHGGPARASAAPQAQFPDLPVDSFPVVDRGAPDEKVLHAAEHVEKLRTQAFGSTPLYYEPEIVPDKPEDSTPDGPKMDPTPDFRVTAILSSATGNIALIGFEAHHEGDQVLGTEWVIVEIDAGKRSVVIEHPTTGRTIKRLVELPRH